MKIFLIHTRRTGYGVIRALAGRDCVIYGADTARTEAGFSKYLKDFFLVPEISSCTEEKFLAILIDLAERMRYEEEKPVVFTGKDDYLLFFSKHYPTLSRYYHLSFETDYATLNKALDKLELSKVAAEAGVVAPKSYRLSDFSGNSKIPFPVVIKPAIKCRPEIDVVVQGFRVSLCKNLDELKAAATILEKLDQPYIIQEFIPGEDSTLYTCGVYCFKGKLIAWSTSRKLRQFPPKTGECTLGETLYLPELVEPSEKLIKAIGLSGILQIEYKKSGDKYYLIEINPRIWSWHELNRLVGVNLVEIALNTVLGEKSYDHLIAPDQTRKTWNFLSMDILHNALLTKNVSLAQILVDALCADLGAFFNWRDPRPWFEHWKKTIPYMRLEVKKHRAKG